jgi:hypothetical protein
VLEAHLDELQSEEWAKRVCNSDQISTFDRISIPLSLKEISLGGFAMREARNATSIPEPQSSKQKAGKPANPRKSRESYQDFRLALAKLHLLSPDQLEKKWLEVESRHDDKGVGKTEVGDKKSVRPSKPPGRVGLKGRSA